MRGGTRPVMQVYCRVDSDRLVGTLRNEVSEQRDRGRPVVRPHSSEPPIQGFAAFAMRQRRISLLKKGESHPWRNRCLSIPKLRILDSSVCRGIPNLVAAPDGPETRPPLSARAASIKALSRSVSRTNP